MGLLVVLAFLAIIVSLGVALRSMSRRNSDSSRMATALTVRIVLSVALFAFLILAWAAGWIQPHGIGG
jgi:hypothetical protein